MIDHALAAERTQPSGARYAVDDGCVLRTVATGTMALVTAGLSLNNVPDLRLALVSVRRILVSGGRLAFTVPHPCFETPDAVWISDHCGVPRRVIGDYTVERFWRSANPQGARRAGTYHRTLSTYLNTLVEVGFTVDLVAEPMPTPKVVGAHPARIALPPFLVVGCRLP
jgi:SAM-dependent methyltransferase